MTKALDLARQLEVEHGRRPQQLMLWGEQMRGMSKRLAHSALFSVRDKRAARMRFEDHVVKSLQNIAIRYTGIQLDQDDHLVFMQLCHLARVEPFGVTVHVTGLAALKGLQWGRSRDDYDRLRACYKRLLEGTVYVSTTGPKERVLYGSHLLHSVGVEEDISDDLHATWTIVLNPKLADILTGDEMTLIDWVRHYKLSALAKWLHGFYSTHDVPLPYKAETLHGLCGSKQADMRGFRFKLKKGLDELIAAEFIIDYEVGPKPSYLVSVRRAATIAAEIA